MTQALVKEGFIKAKKVQASANTQYFWVVPDLEFKAKVEKARE
jgi:hypothetical protein